jgi:hypothetical protein
MTEYLITIAVGIISGLMGIGITALIAHSMERKSSCRKFDHSDDLISIRHSLLGEEFYVVIHLDRENKSHLSQAQEIEQHVCDRLPGAKIYWNHKKDVKTKTIVVDSIVVDFLYQNIHKPTLVDVRSITLDLKNKKDTAIVKNLVQFWHILNRYSGGEIMSQFVDNPESFSIDDLLALNNQDAKKVIQDIINLQATATAEDNKKEELEYREILDRVFKAENITYKYSSKNIVDYLNGNIPLKSTK